MSKEWYVLNTKVKQEQRAQRELERQDYSTLLPLNKSGHVAFPGYIFIEVDIDRDYTPVRSTRGVVGFVRFGSYMPPVPHKVVEHVRSVQVEHKEKFPPDSNVRFREGPMAHHEAIVKAVESGEIVVLYKLMNQWQEGRFPLSSVEAA